MGSGAIRLPTPLPPPKRRGGGGGVESRALRREEGLNCVGDGVKPIGAAEYRIDAGLSEAVKHRFMRLDPCNLNPVAANSSASNAGT